MGRTAIITGCNRGIGKAILERFAKEEGICILAHARAESDEFTSAVEKLRAENSSVKIIPFYFDLGKPDEVKTSLRDILKEHKKVDVLVNNAGVMQKPKSFLMLDEETLRKTFEINYFSQVKITQIVCRAMIRNGGGSIVNTASIAAFSGGEGQFEYVTSKAAIVGMTRILAMELSMHNIRVNAVAPGMINTDMIMQVEAGMRADLLNRSVSKRLGNPSEIANCVYFLAGKEASYVNGQTLIIDGGGMSS